ncbi:glycosyltransferase [Carboxylicivirga taeanensis]|uniref:glycosyltransferase n=1 Tax=Carboxylicivirga taeanensis TaxID=1416875 RepID=UPI003F6DA7E1
MAVIYLTLLLPLFAYSVQIISWYVQWMRSHEYHAGQTSQKGISLIIPFKDEASNLPALLQSLEAQTYKNWELILVNDHSTDNGVAILEELLVSFKGPATIINSSQTGKKAALLEGAKQAQYPLLVTTDADCTFSSNWLSTLSAYAEKYSPDLLIGPVSLKKAKGFLQRFQQVDFTALQISGAAAALQQQAIMCNGANLLCSKDLYLKAHLQPNIASGDDMFLLEWMKSQHKSIHFIKSKAALVETAPVSQAKALLQQRARWAAKAPHYKDKRIVLTGAIVAAVNLVLILSFIGSWFIPELWKLWGIYLFIKCLVDYMLLKAGSDSYKLKITLFEVIFWQLLYPLYVITVLLFPLFFEVRWKGRSI